MSPVSALGMFLHSTATTKTKWATTCPETVSASQRGYKKKATLRTDAETT